jgi:hypothetical protein
LCLKLLFVFDEYNLWYLNERKNIAKNCLSRLASILKNHKPNTQKTRANNIPIHENKGNSHNLSRLGIIRMHTNALRYFSAFFSAPRTNCLCINDL